MNEQADFGLLNLATQYAIYDPAILTDEDAKNPRRFPTPLEFVQMTGQNPDADFEELGKTYAKHYENDLTKRGVSPIQANAMADTIQNRFFTGQDSTTFARNWDALTNPQATAAQQGAAPEPQQASIPRSVVHGAGQSVGSSISGISDAGHALDAVLGTIGWQEGDWLPTYYTPAQVRAMQELFPEFMGIGSDPIYQAGQAVKDVSSVENPQVIPSAIGSALGTLGTVAVGGVAGLGAKGAVALGMAQSATQLANEGADDYRQTLEKNGKPLDAQQLANVTFLNSTLSLADAIPGGRLAKSMGLKALDESTGGWLKKAILGGASEGITETAQTLAQNWIANGIVKYDPERDIWEGGAEAGTGGAAAGAFMNTLAHMMGGRRSKNNRPADAPEEATIAGLTADQTRAYVATVANTESSGNQSAINDYGYSGLYQFGASALADVGLIKREAFDAAPAGVKRGTSGQKEFLQNPDNWTTEGGLDAFLASRAVQDKAFIDFTNLNIQRGRKSGALQDDADAGQIAGYAKAAHLLGSGGADAYVLSGDDGADANGTTASKYYAQGRDAVLNASADNQPKAKQNTDAGKNPLDALEEEAAAREVTQANRELAGLAPAASRPGYQQNTRPATPPPPGYLTQPGPTAIRPESIQQDVTSTTPEPGVQVGNGEIALRINPGYHPSPEPQQENTHAGLEQTRPLDAPAQPANAAATSTQPRPVDALAGRQATLYDAANNEYIAEYEVIDAAALSPSIEKADNQYRDRNRTAMQAQVDSIAANPIYGRLNTQHSTFTDGAPVLTQDQTLVAGNGRMAGLKQAYEQGNADNYRQQLMTDAHRLGLDTEAIGQMQQPVLVRRLTDSNTDTRKLAILSNVGTGASMSDLEQAKVDAEYIQHLGDFNPDDNADINFQSAPGLFQRLRAAVPESERNSIMTADGKVSADGARRVRNALMYMAYGDSKVLSDMVESQDPDHVNITKALLQAAPRLAEMRDSIRQGIVYDADITPDIVQSFSLFKQIRRDQGNTLESWLNQQDAFGDTPDTVKSLIRRMDEGAKKPSQLRDFLNNYADKLKTYGNPNQQGMFGGNPVPTKQEVLQRAERDTYQQSDASTTAETTSNSVGRPAGTGNTGTTGPQAAGQPGVNEAGAGGAGRSGTVGDTRFHISGRKPADITDQDTELTAAWKYIAQSDDAFQLPVSGKKSLEDIAADYNPNIRVEKSFELRDSITWSVKVPVAGGEIREVFVDEEKGGKREIFMDISQFQPGEGGNLLYQMVGDYAHNTGKIFAGDPSGLSPIAQIRRTENMLSSALRWGTTDHLRPHPLQLKPESDQVAPLSWKDGDTIYNLDQMLRTTMQNTLNMVPELKQVVYNPDKKQFEKVNGDGSTEPVSDRLFTEMARTGHGRRAATGSSTLKRAVYSSSVLQGQGQKVRHGLLGKIISQWSKPRLDQPLEGILYHLQPSTLNQTIRQVADTHGLDATTEAALTEVFSTRPKNPTIATRLLREHFAANYKKSKQYPNKRAYVTAKMNTLRKTGALEQVSNAWFEQGQNTIRLSDGVPGQPIPRAQAEAAISRILKGQRFETRIPDHIRVMAGDAAERVRGVFHDGTIYIDADNMGSIAEAEAVAVEELTHAGVRTLFGKEYDARLNALHGALGGEQGIRRFLERNKIAMAEDYFGMDKATQMDELLAHIEAANQSNSLSVRVKRAYQRVIGHIREQLRRLGASVLPNASDSDLILLASRARKAAADGKAVANIKSVGPAANRPANFSISESEFNTTAKSYGGEPAWQAAKDAGRTVLSYREWVQVRTPAFKAWFGDWENERTRNEGVGKTSSGRNDSRPAGPDRGGKSDVQRIWRLNPNTGEPNRFYHGTADTFTRFDLNHPNRKDQGWLGRGIYTASDRRLAESYSRLKQGNDTPQVMELFVNVRNPRVFNLEEKQKLARLSQPQIDALTRQMIAEGYDGAVLPFNDGTLEIDLHQ